MNKNNSFFALVKREFLEHRNAFFWTPVVLLGISFLLVVLAILGYGSVKIDTVELQGASNLSDLLSLGIEREGEAKMSLGITTMYWATGLTAWIALPIVVFFALLGSLYEERRDRSILFWKSMPVADWQEVLAKTVACALLAPAIFLVLAAGFQIAVMLFLSLIVLFQGGPVGILWPLDLMIMGWISGFLYYINYLLVALPIVAWIILASSYAPRMPFMYAVLPPVVLIAFEGLFFKTYNLGQWIGSRLVVYISRDHGSINGPEDLLEKFSLGEVFTSFGTTLASGNFWIGLVIAMAFFFGAVEMRKRAI